MDSKRSSEAEHTVRLMQAVDRIDAERKVANAEIAHLGAERDALQRRIEALESIAERLSRCCPLGLGMCKASNEWATLRGEEAL